ncbi:MAG: 16S rRNA (cytidine(1402)-2'-O)-methyltransferase, partial [Acidobacteria bacterium]|nr:16S rRNA (cytidine(1402)-2'-O)-methyltransferase [Acidobacteriota bacterium]
MSGTLYLVATPIGNLSDITERALRVLREVELVACEDTRHTGALLNHYSIKTKLVSYHEHNERERAIELGRLLETGASIALVSDAGTPGISDPGFRLVNAAHELGARVVPVPGATAFVAALIASGLPTDQFFFGGFLPARSSQRRARLEDVREIPATLVFYEAPHRIVATLRDAHEILGEREAAIARELTKLHEEIVRGRLSEMASRFDSAERRARGEMVIVIDRTIIREAAQDFLPNTNLAARVAALESEGMEMRAALKKAAREFGLTRDEAYRRLTAA